MKIQCLTIALHVVLGACTSALLSLCVFYPFLPGGYDSLAMPLSTMAQAFGVLGLPLVPVGVLWFVRALLGKGTGYGFALAATVVSTLIAVIVSRVGFAVAGPALGVVAFALWLGVLWSVVSMVRRMKNAERKRFSFAPLYLIFVPGVVFVLQMTLAGPVTEWSRMRAIANSAEMIRDIEAYRVANGEYPKALAAAWKDYYPDVVGVEKYHYMPRGDAYNLFFEQPRFLFDSIGTREYVVYNSTDEHMMLSHTSWILILKPEELAEHPGWYESHDAGAAHWKYFWFD